MSFTCKSCGKQRAGCPPEGHEICEACEFLSKPCFDTIKSPEGHPCSDAADAARFRVVYWSTVLEALQPQLGTKGCENVDRCFETVRALFLDACADLDRELRSGE